MSLLTDREINSIAYDDDTSRGPVTFARAVEAAVIKKLVTVSVGPVGEVSGNAWDEGILYRDCEPGEPLYTAEAVAAARVQALEEAENACRVKVQREAGYGGQWEGYGPSMTYRTGPECEAAIRALIGGKE